MKGAITISRPSFSSGKEVISIKVEDYESGIRFLDIEIGYSDFARLITGLSGIHCDMTVRGLANIGKVKEQKTIEFKIPDYHISSRNGDAIKEAKNHTHDGWTCDNYFSRQSSFFFKCDQYWARASIFRYVDVEQDSKG